MTLEESVVDYGIKIDDETIIPDKGENPFSQILSLSVTVLRNTNAITNKSQSPIYIDREEKVSLFRSKRKEALIYSLSPSSNLILRYMEFNIDKNIDYIEMKDKEVVDILKISRASFFNGIKELIFNNVIAKHPLKKNTYWINPALFFFGDRPAKYEKCIKHYYEWNNKV